MPGPLTTAAEEQPNRAGLRLSSTSAICSHKHAASSQFPADPPLKVQPRTKLPRILVRLWFCFEARPTLMA